MKNKIRSLFILCVVLLPVLTQAGNGIPLEKASHLRLDSIVYYQNPLVIKFMKMQESITPVWYPALCADSYPDYFKDYINDAADYFYPTKLTTDELLFKQKYYKENPIEKSRLRPYNLVYGELYITCKTDNKKVLIVYTNELKNPIPNMDYQKLDPSLLAKSETCFKDKTNPYFEIYTGGTLSNTFIFDDSKWKLADPYFVFENLMNQSGKTKVEDLGVKEFQALLLRLNTYSRSRIVDGKRIVERMVKTPNGFKVENGAIGMQNKP